MNKSQQLNQLKEKLQTAVKDVEKLEKEIGEMSKKEKVNPWGVRFEKVKPPDKVHTFNQFNEYMNDANEAIDCGLAYNEDHPGQRFWQVIRNFTNNAYIYKQGWEVGSSNDIQDTFYIENDKVINI